MKRYLAIRPDVGENRAHVVSYATPAERDSALRQSPHEWVRVTVTGAVASTRFLAEKPIDCYEVAE